MRPWFARNLLYRPATWLRGEPVFRLLQEYRKSQWLDPQLIRRRQEEGVERIMRYASTHTRHYGRIVSEQGLDPAGLEAQDLERFPVLQKQQLVEDSASLQAWRPPFTTSWKTTGGSTGTAVRLRKNRGATAAEQAASWRSYEWYGVGPGDRQARFWGTPLTGRSRARTRLIDRVLNRVRFSAFAFREEDLEQYYRSLAKARPTWVYGYVSMLVQFASFCLRRRFDLPGLGLRAVVTTSEVLTEGDRRMIATAFGSPVFNEYGCGEVGAILYECERGLLHLMAENLFLELVDDPTAEEPRACRILLTDLHNRATPLIRYDIRDRVVPAGACACGRGLPAFAKVFGRAYDFLEAADGTRYHGEFFLYVVEEARDAGVPVRQVQVVEQEPGRLTLRVIPGVGYEASHGERIANRISAKSDGRFRVDVDEVSELPREPSGKLRLIKARSAGSEPAPQEQDGQTAS